METITAGPLIYRLSSDPLPTDIQPGTRLQFIDTGERLIFDGFGWVTDLSLIYALRSVA